MTKTEQTRLRTWRLKVLQHAGIVSGRVDRAQAAVSVSTSQPGTTSTVTLTPRIPRLDR